MISCKENGKCYMAWHCATHGCADKSWPPRDASSLENKIEQILLGTKEDFEANVQSVSAGVVVKANPESAKKAIEIADSQMKSLGLPTYTELLGSLRALNENSWLDADTGTDDLEDAKAKARAFLRQAEAI
jgi:hypothetical protein